MPDQVARQSDPIKRLAQILQEAGAEPVFTLTPDLWREVIGDIVQERDEAVAKLNETYVDDYGTTWNVPTAWAYAQACRVRDEAQQQLEAADKATESTSIKLANLTADLKRFEFTANSLWRNQQMSTQSVASGLLDLITKFVDDSFLQIDAALGMRPMKDAECPTD